MGFYKFFSKHPLRQEILLIILVKLMALTALWYFFVRDHKVPHDTPATTYHLLNNK